MADDSKKILLVEDDNNLREIYGARLQAEGYNIVSAPDGENALAIAVKEKPDLIITDVMMPKISGFDMLDILRNAPETKDTKVIMMTALSQAEDKARADKLGADLYLVKSQVTLEDVAKAVHKILDEDSSQTESAAAEGQEMVDKQSNEQTENNQTQDSQPAPQPDADTTPSVTSESAPQPEAAPEPVQEPPQPEAAPASPEAPAPSEPPSEPAPAPQPTPTAIPVSEPPAENPPEQQPAPAPADDQGANGNVQPNLAQALEDEEKAVQKKIENFENQMPDINQGKAEGQAETPAEAPKEPTIQDQATTNVGRDDAQAAQEPAEEQTIQPSEEAPAEGDKPAKRVIEPLNDPTEGPDINALLQKENEAEAAQNPVSGTITPDGSIPPAEVTGPIEEPDGVQEPPTSAPAPADDTDENSEDSDSKPDDLGKISL